MRERKDDKNEMPVYESHPPTWLPKAHISGDLGYPGFHPPRPGQDEDVLSDVSVKNGFILGHAVSAETFSAQATMNDGLRSDSTISQLEELMNEVFLRRAQRIPPIPQSTFRIPSRATLNDSKRQAWFADLANPNVPLHKLGKNVPHGAKNHDLLDLLHSNNVAIPRAVWFLRVFGANETAGLRNKPTYNPTQYSIEWATVVTSYMKKQLAEISLPSAPRPGLNIKQTFKGVLADPESRERWISRFTYCLKLLRTFYSEGLVDKRTFLVWVLQQLGTCNLAQAGFVCRLADEYLDAMIGSRPLTRPLVDACLCKLAEIRTSPAQEFLVDTEGLFKVLLQRLCLAIPDAFVSPRMWMDHSALLTSVLTENILDHPADQHVQQNTREVHQIILENFYDIKRRNEAMLFRNLPFLVSARLGSAVSDVELLNSISDDTDMSSLPFFHHSSDYSSGLTEKLDTLLTWSVTPLQFGDHRPFAAVTLIRHWRDRASDRATRRGSTPPDEVLQDRLFDWLDTSDIAGEAGNIRAVALLFGKLVKHDLFSYSVYIQRLIARGETGLTPAEDVQSRHRNFLRWIPLLNSSSSLVIQRRVTLYGPRARDTPEDQNEREIRKEIRAVLPELFGGEPLPPPNSSTELVAKCGNLAIASRFEQVRTYRLWLLPILRKHIASQYPEATRQPTILKSYCTAVELMTQTKCFHCILDLTLCMLEHSTTVDLLTAVIDTLHRFATLWASMDLMGSIINGLYSAHHLWKIRGIQSRALLALLMEFDHGRYLTETSREQILADISSFTLALQPHTEHPDNVPDVLPEILLLANDFDGDAPSILANGLWIKYRRSQDWAWKVWDNTVASLRQIPAMVVDTAARRGCALRYGTFLWHVDQHLPAGLDNQVLRWFLGPGKNEIAALSADAWDIVTVVLLYLSVHGALKTTTILQGLISSAWQLGASASAEQQSPSLETFLHAANNLCRRLLLRDDGSGDIMPPTDLLDVQCIRTRRQDVYRKSHFPLIVASIPLLVVLENNAHVPEHLRVEAASIRRALCEDQDFRQGVFRSLDAVRDAFERPILSVGEGGEDLNKHIIAALRMVLCEATDDIELSSWPDTTSLLSPWKISATAIQLQFVLRQMGQTKRESQGVTNAGLDKLASMIFHHTLSSEEAYFIAQMTKGVGSAVAGKFINNGLQCVTEIIAEAPFDPALDTFADCLKRAGDLLRVLIYVAEPLRDESTQLPSLDAGIQDKFFGALHKQFRDAESLLESHTMSSDHVSQATAGIILLARFLQFDLGFGGVWTGKTKEASSDLFATIFRLTLLHTTGNNHDLIAYPLLLDTLYFLVDEIPVDPQVGPFDPFRHYPDIPTSGLPSDLPIEYKNQLRALLHHLPSPSSVAGLASAHRGPSGNLIYDNAVINRPWEWIENLGEPSLLDLKDDEREREEKERLKVKYLVKNSGSLSLDMFGAKMTDDGIIHAQNGADTATKGNMRLFEDGLSAEGVFTRDWRETRIDVDMDANSGKSRSEGDQHETGVVNNPQSNQSRADRRTTPRGSPAPTITSRSSNHGSVKSRQSPGLSSAHHRHSNSTTSEIIDIDSIASASSSRQTSTSKSRAKRKPPTSDDEVIIVEGPVPVNKTKKQKTTKAPAKSKAKKR